MDGAGGVPGDLSTLKKDEWEITKPNGEEGSISTRTSDTHSFLGTGVAMELTEHEREQCTGSKLRK